MRTHGTYPCYVWGPEPGCKPGRGCRCDPCRAAASDYLRQTRQRTAPALVARRTAA